jgi:hypothetical protein
MKTPSPPAAASLIPPDRREQGRRLDAAREGDPEALAWLRQVLDQHPEIGQEALDIRQTAERALMKTAFGDNPVDWELGLRQMATLRADLLGATPTPLERLLVERIVASWLTCWHAEVSAAQGGADPQVSIKACDYRQRRLDRAHRRLLSAIRTLAIIRRLEQPLVLQQTNIQADQVIVGSPEPPAPLGLEERELAAR